MLKIFLKKTNGSLERYYPSNPKLAAEAWNKLRSQPWDGKPIALQAIYGNRIFMQHYFHADPGTTDYVPVGSVTEDTFVRGMVGDDVHGN